MSPFDTAKSILAKASFYDSRIPQADTNVARAWAEALGPIDIDDALTAVVEHYRQPAPDRVMPGDILDRVHKIRAERIRSANAAILEPHDVDPDDIPAYLAAGRQRRALVGSGQTPEPEVLPATARDVEKLMAKTAAQLPKIPPAKPRTDLDKKRAAGRAS